MKKNLKWLGLGGVLAAAMLMAMDLPAKDSNSAESGIGLYEDLVRSCMTSAKKDCISWAKEGGEMPRGLSKDTMVELAIGERYALSGIIDFIAGQPFLRIDFRKHPWLANRTRVKNPVYRIKDQAANWSKYIGQPVTMIGTARYTVFLAGGRTMLEIYIEPAADPVPSALQPHFRR